MFKYKFKTICINNIMGSLNPETLYEKVYTDMPFKKDGVIINEVTTKDFREFLQRTKPNFNSLDNSTDKELLETLSVLVNNNMESGNEICNDIQKKFCNSVCDKIYMPTLLKPKVVIASLTVAFSAIIIYKMRKNSKRKENEREANNNPANNNQANNNQTNENDVIDNKVDSDNDTDIVSEKNNPRVVFIKKSWFW